MFLLIDIGGTNLRLSFSKDLKTISRPHIFPTPKKYGQALQNICQKSKDLAKDNLEAICIGIPGVLNKEKTCVLTSPNLPDWCDQPIREQINESLDTPVFMENDADLAGLGEAVFGSGKTHNSIAYFTISTGVGGARIIDKKIDSATPLEPGHQTIIADGLPCGCGGSGHLEAYVSGSGLKKLYNQKPEDIKDPKIWEEVTRLLSIGLINSTVHWSPDCIILGGSIMKSLPFDKLEKNYRESHNIVNNRPPLKLAALGDRSGLHGSLVLLKQKTK